MRTNNLREDQNKMEVRPKRDANNQNKKSFFYQQKFKD